MEGVFVASADESLRQEVRESVPWKQLDLVLTGEASDGQLSLPMIRDLKPGVLIASPDMPFLDGYQLAKLVLRDFPWMQVIMLCSDWDHGKDQGANYQFLQRPVNGYELGEALRRAQKNMQEMQTQMRQKVYASLSSGVAKHFNQYQNLADWLEIQHEQRDSYRECDRKHCRIVRISEEKIQLTAVIWGVLRLFEEMYRPSGEVKVLEVPDGLGMIVVSDDLLRLESAAYRIAAATRNAIRIFTDKAVRMQISRVCSSRAQLFRAWQEICALDGIQTDKRPILGAEDDLRPWRPISPGVRALEERLIGAEDGDVPGIIQYYKKKGVLNGPLFARAVNNLLAECGAEGGEEPQKTDKDIEIQLRRAIRRRDEMAPHLKDLPIARARHYAGENFLKPGPLIYGAARSAGMSVNRLNVVFYQETGLTFTEYLLRMRVNASKELLITPMRISRIAETVGLNGVAYYEAMFIGYAGMDPREYRRIHTPEGAAD